jgi:hypothetical protein
MFRIVATEIQVPDPQNLRWVFRMTGSTASGRELGLDAYDLNHCFKEAVGRYMVGADDSKKRDDILNNWKLIEPILIKRFSETVS